MLTHQLSLQQQPEKPQETPPSRDRVQHGLRNLRKSQCNHVLTALCYANCLALKSDLRSSIENTVSQLNEVTSQLNDISSIVKNHLVELNPI